MKVNPARSKYQKYSKLLDWTVTVLGNLLLIQYREAKDKMPTTLTLFTKATDPHVGRHSLTQHIGTRLVPTRPQGQLTALSSS